MQPGRPYLICADGEWTQMKQIDQGCKIWVRETLRDLFHITEKVYAKTQNQPLLPFTRYAN